MQPHVAPIPDIVAIAGSPSGRFKLPVSVTNASWGIGMSGVFVDFTPGEVKLVLEGIVSIGTLIDVHISECEFPGEVLYCQRREEGFETHVSINDSDESGLRRTPRFPVRISATVSSGNWASPTPLSSSTFRARAWGLKPSVQLPTTGTVAVESESNLALGVIRHCREVCRQCSALEYSCITLFRSN
jgi:hypothetical protein